jgi:peptide methionine sulfoxide reductase MsrA
MLEDDGYAKVKLSAAKYTKGNLILTAHPQTSQIQLNNAFTTIKALLEYLHTTVDMPTPNNFTVKANIKWST